MQSNSVLRPILGPVGTQPDKGLYASPVAPRPPEQQLRFLNAYRALSRNPIEAFERAAYEKPFHEINRWGRRLLIVSDPGAIERVLVDNAANYLKSDQQQRRLKPALGNGLLTAEGDAWRATRRITAPLFSPRVISDLAGDMHRAADEMAARWRGRHDRGVPLDCVEEFQRLTYEIASMTMFSGALDDDRLAVQANMALYFNTVGRIDLASLLRLPEWLPTPARARARPAMRHFQSIVQRVVAERQGTTEMADLLDRLMHAVDPATGARLSQGAVADNILTFLAAGHETTANALAWIFYLLALTPDVNELLRAELDTIEAGAALSRTDLNRLPMTMAVINEAMRLYPPAPFIGREAIAADRLGDQEIKPGAQVLISPWIVHRHRALWADPDQFRPERFLETPADDLPRGMFLPFGLGPRICIGKGFAMQEIVTVLAVLLPRFRFQLVDPGEIYPLSNITLRPAPAVRMMLRPIG